MQQIRHIAVGQIYEDKSDPCIVVEVTAVDYHKDEVHYRYIKSPRPLSKVHNWLSSGAFMNSVQPVLMSFNGVKIGDRYFSAAGDEYEVVGFDVSADEYHLRSVANPAGFINRVSGISMGRLFHPKASFPPGNGPKAGLSVWIPEQLPAEQSNEFFGVSMKNLTNKCTCGIDSIGGGKHSDWCDKKEKIEILTVEVIQNVINRIASKP